MRRYLVPLAAALLLLGCQHTPRYQKSSSGNFEWRITFTTPPAGEQEPPPVEVLIQVPDPSNPDDIARGQELEQQLRQSFERSWRTKAKGTEL